MSLKKIHRIYFGFDGKPDPYLGYLKTWTEQLPDYEILHWNADNLPMDSCFFSKKMFELRDYAFLSDYFRWWVVREHGGCYFDADIEVLNGRKFNAIIESLQDSPDLEAVIGIDNKAGGWFTAHSMGAKPNSQYARFMCWVYESLGPTAIWRRNIFYYMAPQMAALYFAYNGHNVAGMGAAPNLVEPLVRERVKIYPQEYFSPMTPANVDGKAGFEIDALTENSSLCHHFSCSWHEADSPYVAFSRELRGADPNMLLNELIDNIRRKKNERSLASRVSRFFKMS